MEVVTLRVRLLEPLMLRGSGEFDPSSRGVYSHALSLRIPRSSTLAGALISYLLTKEPKLARHCIGADSFSKLLECYERVLDRFGILSLRGPYFYSIKGGEVYVPVRLGAEMLLVDYDQFCYYLLQKYGDLLKPILGGNVNEDDVMKLKHAIAELKRYILSLPEGGLHRTGIMLCDRPRVQGGWEGTKTAKEGYIYTSRYVAYLPDIEIRLKLVLLDDSHLRGQELDTALKLGGEHRVARVTLDSEHRDRVDELFKSASRIARYYLLLSPMPLKESAETRYLGLLDTIGLGFGIARGKRKPLYSAFLEGTIVEVSAIKSGLEKLLEHGLYPFLGMEDSELRVLARVGYASALPLVGGELL